MRRSICILLSVLMLASALAGCGRIADQLPGIPSALPEIPAPAGDLATKAEGEKDYYLEVLSPDGTSLGTIPQGEVLDAAFGSSSDQRFWVLDEERPRDLEPEHLCLLWQEETLLAGQDPGAEREYQVVLQITTFRDTNYIEVEVPVAVAGLWELPEALAEPFLDFSFWAPEEGLEALRKAVEDFGG